MSELIVIQRTAHHEPHTEVLILDCNETNNDLENKFIQYVKQLVIDGVRNHSLNPLTEWDFMDILIGYNEGAFKRLFKNPAFENIEGKIIGIVELIF